MGSVEVLASKSLTISNLPVNIDKNCLLIGSCLNAEFLSYLYFRLPPLPRCAKVERAELVLYETERCCSGLLSLLGSLLIKSGDYPFNEHYGVYPLLDYFSSRTRYGNRPAYTSSISQQGAVNGTVSIQIDLTGIVTQWMSGRMLNKGIVIKRKTKNSRMMCLGSALSNDNTLIPVLKIYFKEIYFPITELNCSYTIMPPVKEKD